MSNNILRIRVLILCIVALCWSVRADNGVLTPQDETRLKQIVIGDKTYTLRWIEGTYGASNNFVSSRADLAYIWDGQTTWVIDPMRGRVLSTLPSKSSILALSPDKALALVVDTSPQPTKDKSHPTPLEHQYAPALMDVASQRLVARFGELENYHLWVFASNGKFIYPLSKYYGDGKYRYVDVEKKSDVEIPIWGDRKTPFSFSGVSTPDGKAVYLFARAQPKADSLDERPVQGARFLNKIIRIETDQPSRVTMMENTPDIETAFAMRDGKILCLLRKFEITGIEENITDEYRIGFVNARSGKVETITQILKNSRIYRANWTPDGKEIYALDDFKGLSIYDARTLKLLATPGVGHIANAYSIGATFSADGKFAFIAEPYKGAFHVIDVASRKVVETNSQLGRGIAGVLPVGDECFIITTFLPYE